MDTKTTETKSGTDKVRLAVLTSAELFDAWRIVPRMLVAGYGWMCWLIVDWYMALQPFLIEGCDLEMMAELCISPAPTTQHAALVTAIVGGAAAVFGLYANTGRSWGKSKFVRWDDTNMQRSERYRQNQGHQYRPDAGMDSESDEFWDSVDSMGDEEFPNRSSNYD